MSNSADIRIGVDLGGSKIEAAALAPDGSILGRKRCATIRHDYAATLRQISDLVGELETELGRTSPAVDIGIPGALSPLTGLVKNANSTWLIGQPLDQDLARALKRPVRLANDANCFALSEASDGAGVGAKVVFGVIIGTGVGGGLVVDGQIIDGRNMIAGEWRHNSLPWPSDLEYPGPDCYCGAKGCIETFISGPGLARDFALAVGLPETEAPDAREIAARAMSGDATAEAALVRYENRLAKSLTGLINLLDPDVIVLGGGMSNLDRLYSTLPGLVQSYAFSDGLGTEIKKNLHGDSSGVRGAAWLWP